MPTTNGGSALHPRLQVTLIAGGIKVALLSSSMGVLILGFAALLWFALQFRWRMLQANEVEDAL